MPGEKVRRSQAEGRPYLTKAKSKKRPLKPDETNSIKKRKETYL